MSKEITKARILQQLEEKFSLRELDPEIFRFSEMVMPTYDIQREIEHFTAQYFTVSITSGPAGFALKVVPRNERWHVRGYNVIFMASGAYALTGIYIKRHLELLSNSFIYLDMKEGQTASYAVNLPQPVVLEPTDVIYVYADSYTSTADMRLYLDYSLEEIR